MSVKLCDLRTFFDNYVHTEKEVKLEKGTTILNINTFAKTHLSALEANPGNSTMIPYYDRIVKLYNILIK